MKNSTKLRKKVITFLLHTQRWAWKAARHTLSNWFKSSSHDNICIYNHFTWNAFKITARITDCLHYQCVLQLKHSSYSVYTLCFLCFLLEEVENKRNYVILWDDDKIQEIPRFRTVLHIIFYYAGMSSISNFASGTHITSLQNYVFYDLGRTQNGKDGQNGCISTYNLV